MKHTATLAATLVLAGCAPSKKLQVVQIDPSDTAFKTNGCQPWQPTDSANADGTTQGVLPALLEQAQLRT